MLKESECTAARCGDDLAPIWINDCQGPVLSNCVGKDCAELLLIRADECSSLGIAVRVGNGFN